MDDNPLNTSSRSSSSSHKKQKWCHLICAQYVSETWFDETGTDLNDVCNVHGIRPKRYEGECAYCGREKGAKVFCSIMGCGTRFHASCGLVNDCMLQDVADPDAEYSNRVVYCPQHLPGVIKKSGNALMKKRFKESQDITINGNQNNLGWGETWDKKIQQEYELKQRQAQQQLAASRVNNNNHNKNKKRNNNNNNNHNGHNYRNGDLGGISSDDGGDDNDDKDGAFEIKPKRKRKKAKAPRKKRVSKKIEEIEDDNVNGGVSGKEEKNGVHKVKKNVVERKNKPPMPRTQPPPLAPYRRRGFFHAAARC